MENIDWIKDIIYILPLLAIVWRGALLASRVKQNEKDIEELKITQRDQNKQILESLTKLNDTMIEIKTDVALLKALRDKEESHGQHEQ